MRKFVSVEIKGALFTIMDVAKIGCVVRCQSLGETVTLEPYGHSPDNRSGWQIEGKRIKMVESVCHPLNSFWFKKWHEISVSTF